jgi:hypothetical protein
MSGVKVNVVAVACLLAVVAMLASVHNPDAGAAVLLIVGGMCTMAFIVMNWDLKRRAMGSRSGSTQDVDLGQLKTVKDELVHLRDTSTQFDVSLQHTLDRIERRLDHLEQRMNAEVASAAKADPVVTQSTRL